VKANTPVGKLLALDESGGVGKPEKLVAAKAKVLNKTTPQKAKMKRVSTSAEHAVNVGASLPPILAAKIRFREVCSQQQHQKGKGKKGGGAGEVVVEELKASAFAALVRLLMTEGGVEEMPSDADMKAAFTTADVNKSGTIDEGEFAKLYHLVLGGKVTGLSKTGGGLLFGPSKAQKKQKEEFKTKLNGIEGFDDKTGKLKSKPKPKEPVKPNFLGLAVRPECGSSEYFSLEACFLPLCASGKEGDALRVEMFKSADPNGNGLCSLAELETFVLQRLLTTYPNSGKGKEVSVIHSLTGCAT
jgi:hypothetical protein